MTIVHVSVRQLEKAKTTGQFAVSSGVDSRSEDLTFDESGSEDSDDGSGQVVKKLKLSGDL